MPYYLSSKYGYISAYEVPTVSLASVALTGTSVASLLYPLAHLDLYMTVNVHWEGGGVTTDMRDSINALQDAYTWVKYSHFINPALYTSGSYSDAAVDAYIDSIVRVSGTKQMHIHPYNHLVTAAGVTPRTAPTYTSQVGPSALNGYDVFLPAYTKAELMAIFDYAANIFVTRGWTRPTAFLSGGWWVDAKALSALVAVGFTKDSSRVPPSIIDVAFAGYYITTPIGIDYKGETTERQNYVINTEEGDIFEVPSQTAVVEYESVAAQIAYYQTLASRKEGNPGTPYGISFGIHLDTPSGHVGLQQVFDAIVPDAKARGITLVPKTVLERNELATATDVTATATTGTSALSTTTPLVLTPIAAPPDAGNTAGLWVRTGPFWQDAARTVVANDGDPFEVWDDYFGVEHLTWASGPKPTVRSGGGADFPSGCFMSASIAGTGGAWSVYMNVYQGSAGDGNIAFCDGTGETNEFYQVCSSGTDSLFGVGFGIGGDYDIVTDSVGLKVRGIVQTAGSSVGFANATEVTKVTGAFGVGSVRFGCSNGGFTFAGYFMAMEFRTVADDSTARTTQRTFMATALGDIMADKTTAGSQFVLTAVLTGATVHLTVGGTEVSTVGTGYSAQPWGTVAFSPSNTAVQQADIVFGTSATSWGTVNGVRIKNGSTIIYEDTFTGVPVASGNSIKFPAGALTIQETLCRSTRGKGCRFLWMWRSRPPPAASPWTSLRAQSCGSKCQASR